MHSHIADAEVAPVQHVSVLRSARAQAATGLYCCRYLTWYPSNVLTSCHIIPCFSVVVFLLSASGSSLLPLACTLSSI